LGRIDHADVSSEAGAIIDELRSHARGDFSSILKQSRRRMGGFPE
jgi:hypothetical protein